MVQDRDVFTTADEYTVVYDLPICSILTTPPPIPDFKVMPTFDADYIGNGRR